MRPERLAECLLLRALRQKAAEEGSSAAALPAPPTAPWRPEYPAAAIPKTRLPPASARPVPQNTGTVPGIARYHGCYGFHDPPAGFPVCRRQHRSQLPRLSLLTLYW